MARSSATETETAFPRTKPEILSPAGGWPQLTAAVENGADAVYFGLTQFNARARACNFSSEELPEVMRYLRERGVKGYVVLNVLVFDEELEELQQCIRGIAEAGVNAVIVQDLGAVELIRQVAPGLEIHGSTQMSITDPQGVQFTQQLGVSRVVVGRELSVEEISKVRQGSTAEVEVFVHGALCVSYSGQCFSSEAWGGRSANRGQCAQACRMPYGLLVDGVLKELGDMKYLLSPQDLMAIEKVPDLIEAGVSCFKIEGRLKGPEYVALTTAAYRRAVDIAWGYMYPSSAGAAVGKAARSGRVVKARAAGDDDSLDGVAMAKAAVQLEPQQRWDLEQVFARGQDEQYKGLTPGFLDGSQHQRLVRGRAPRHRGLLLGKVTNVGKQGKKREYVIMLDLKAPVRAGDGVVFDMGDPETAEPGGTIIDILDARGRSLQTGRNGSSSVLAVVPPLDESGQAVPGFEVGLVFATDNYMVAGRGERSRNAAGAQGAELQRRKEGSATKSDLSSVQVGHLVWKTKDVMLEQRLKASYASLSSNETRKIQVDVVLRGSLGKPMTLLLQGPDGVMATAASAVPLQAAAKRPLDANAVMEALGPHLGHPSLTCGAVDMSNLSLEEGLFLPASELKALRRCAVEELLQQLQDTRAMEGLVSQNVLPHIRKAIQSAAAADKATAQEGTKSAADSTSQTSTTVLLRVLCRTPEQVGAALKVDWLQEVVLDFLEVQGLRAACNSVKAAGKRVVVATPRILKPGEQRLWQFYVGLGADALLLRSTGILQQLLAYGGQGGMVPGLEKTPIPALEGDFSLNAANIITADWLLRQGLNRLAPTHDLNASQICTMARGLGERACNIEVIVHQHLPIFHTEHCVFCRFLSSGNSYKDCGQPCEKHTVHLRDHNGADHLVLADMGCRNTVFNAQAQSGASYLNALKAAGVKTFRIEFVDEPAHVVAPVLEGYRDVLNGQRQAGNLLKWLATLPDSNGACHGVSPGSLAVKFERQRSELRPTAAALRHNPRSKQALAKS